MFTDWHRHWHRNELHTILWPDNQSEGSFSRRCLQWSGSNYVVLVTLTPKIMTSWNSTALPCSKHDIITGIPSPNLLDTHATLIINASTNAYNKPSTNQLPYSSTKNDPFNQRFWSNEWESESRIAKWTTHNVIIQTSAQMDCPGGSHNIIVFYLLYW